MGSAILHEYKFDFTFWCPRINIRWSARSFPEQFTKHMIFHGTYQHDVLLWLKHLCRKGDVVFDVGAFHGLMSVVGSKAVGPRGRVIAFEPNPAARAHMEHHLALNRCQNVTVEPLGLMDKDQTADFFVQAGENSWNSSFVQDFVDPAKNVKPLQVKCITLDQYVDRTGVVPKVVKIDTEGTEFLVLKGAQQTLAKYKPFLIMEFNRESATRADTSIETIMGQLESLNYTFWTIPRSRFGSYRWRARTIFDEKKHMVEELANVACVPRNARQATGMVP